MIYDPRTSNVTTVVSFDGSLLDCRRQIEALPLIVGGDGSICSEVVAGDNGGG